MLNRNHLIFLTIAFATVGCTSTPSIQTAANSQSPFDSALYGGQVTQLAKATEGSEPFRAFYQGGSGFVSLASVRETVEDMATKHCARQEKNVHLLQERTSTPPHIIGNFPRVEWVFECIERKEISTTAADKLAQLERLKKLLDSGALTQQEFEHEKTKILATP